MSRRLLGITGTIAALALFAGAERASAQSFGLMNLPSTVPQYLGWGYGAGRHAPIVRTPAYHPDRVHRMRIVPACYGPLCPAPYELMGCYGGACQGPMMYPPTVTQPQTGTSPPMVMAPMPLQGPVGPVVYRPAFSQPPALAQPVPSYVWR